MDLPVQFVPSIIVCLGKGIKIFPLNIEGLGPVAVATKLKPRFATGVFLFQKHLDV
jgi:hypothetical protein